jgi:hypothetical protein
MNGYHFLFCNHPIDGLRLAMRGAVGSQGPSLIMLARQSRSTAASLSVDLPPNYGGPFGLLHAPVAEVAYRVREDNATHRVVFSSASSPENEPVSATLDLLRPVLSDWHTQVVLPYASIPSDLPPLVAGDEVRCAWEVRDTLNESGADAIERLVAELDGVPSAFQGVQLYQRRPGVDASHRIGQLRSLLGDRARHTLVVL